MIKPTSLALALSIATTPAFAQKTNVEDSVANPCMVARVKLLDAQFEVNPLNTPKGKSRAQIEKDIRVAKAEVAKECKPTSALPVPYKIASLTATFS